MMKKPDKLHIDTNPLRLKVDRKNWDVHDHKWVSLLWLQDFKIGLIL